jgi:nitrogen fixation protein FixH
MREATFKLKGGHVLAIVAVFISSIIVANAIFITLALRTFPGVTTGKPYLEGVRYNDRLAEKARADALGWTASIEEVVRDEGRARIVLALKDADGAPLRGLDLGGELRRPAHEGEDRRIDFAALSDGTYEATLNGVEPGLWILTAAAEGPAGEIFRMETRLVLE